MVSLLFSTIINVYTFFCRVGCIFGFSNVILNILGPEVTLLSIEQNDGRMCVWPHVGKSTKLIKTWRNLMFLSCVFSLDRTYQNLYCMCVRVCVKPLSFYVSLLQFIYFYYSMFSPSLSLNFFKIRSFVSNCFVFFFFFSQPSVEYL